MGQMGTNKRRQQLKQLGWVAAERRLSFVWGSCFASQSSFPPPGPPSHSLTHSLTHSQQLTLKQVQPLSHTLGGAPTSAGSTCRSLPGRLRFWPPQQVPITSLSARVMSCNCVIFVAVELLFFHQPLLGPQLFAHSRSSIKLKPPFFTSRVRKQEDAFAERNDVFSC